MTNTNSVSRVKLSLGNRNKSSKLHELQMNALKMIMTLVHNGGLMHLKSSDTNIVSSCYRIKGVSFDHEMDTLDILVQKE